MVDDRYLWTGLLGTSVLAFLALFSASSTGKVVINKSNRDSDVVARNELGGTDRLLRVVVKVRSDEHTPRGLNVRLTINDVNGEQIYSKIHGVDVSISKNDGRVTGGRSTLTKFFVLEPRGSYGFHVEVTPAVSIDRTQILLRENARTLFPVEVITLKSSDAE